MNKKLIDVLEQLIAIPTVSDMSNLELIDFIENFIDGLGGEIHRVYNEQKDKANLVCYFGPDEEGGLILSGHTDTVPAEKDKWIHSPFKLSSGKDDRGRNVYFGRGVADMKTFLAQVLVVVKNFDLSRLKKPLVLVFTYDEEVGCIGIRTALEYMKNLDRKRPAHALIGEPTNFEVLVAHKGHSQMKVRIKGVKGHSSRVDEGVNAIAWGGRVMSLINNLQEKHRKNIRHEDTFTGYPFNTINIGTINGGKSINIIPDECSIEIGYRTLPGDDTDFIFKEIKNEIDSKLLDDIKKENPSADIVCELHEQVPPMFTEDGSEFEKNLREITGENKRLAAHYTTEAGFICQNKINCLISGPGSIMNAHKADEYISEDDVIKGIDIINKLVSRMCT